MNLIKRFLWALSLLALLGGCAPLAAAPVEPTQQPVAAATLIPTLLPAAATASPVPTLPPPPTARPSLPPLPTVPPNTQTVKIFLVALEDNGQSGTKIGCNDSVIGVDVPIADTQAVLRASLNQLLAVPGEYYGQSGLYNALHGSELSLQDLNLVNGDAAIYLQGSLTLGGVCDSPRVKAQLEQTALQFSTVRTVHIWVNGIPLDQLLSSQ